MSVKKLYESDTKRQYKGKFIIMYESIFSGEDLTLDNPNFWGELFLIKPIASYIENEISKLNEELLSRCKKNIKLLITNCIDALGEENIYRIVYSLQTLSTILYSLYKKVNHNHKEYDIIEITFGHNHVQNQMASLLKYCNIFLTGEYSANLKALFINLILIIVTGEDDINGNILADIIIGNNIFESLIHLLKDTSSRNKHGYKIVLILTLLISYKKYESANPFIVKLSILDDELALNGYGQVISSSLSSFCKQFTRFKQDAQESWFTSITSIIGHIFVSDEESKTQQILEKNAVLLALYEATHLNRNFITSLVYTQCDSTLPVLSNNLLTTDQLSVELTVSDFATQTFNLLATFFQYCSIVIQATHTDTIIHNVKLSFLILTCISEDQYANSLMHDANLAFRVHLHKVPMYYRKFSSTTTTSQPLAATLLDLIVEFITSHMRKKFPVELYHLCVGILLRILCYQKRCRIRLNYQWIHLWTALINLLKFLTSNEHYFAKKMNIFSLSTDIVNILNIFVTYGDTFLLSPHTYDELFYEIVRMKLIFLNLNTMGLRYSNNENFQYRDSALKLSNALINIRDILNHFSPKITNWLMEENISTPTENQIMTIITQNYDSLTLKLQDNLDQFERYSEKPKQLEFFNNLVQSIIITTRQTIHSFDTDIVLLDYCNS